MRTKVAMLRRCVHRLQAGMPPGATVAQSEEAARLARQAMKASQAVSPMDPMYAQAKKLDDNATKYAKIKSDRENELAEEQMRSLLLAEMEQLEKDYQKAHPPGPVQTSLNQALNAYRARRGEPITARWWFPWVVIAFIVSLWLPTHWKVNALLWVDHSHDRVKWWVHRQYWRWTMAPEDYALLMEQLEAGVEKSKRVKATECPL